MVWQIISYESPRGEKLVKEFLFSLQKKSKGKISQLIDLLQKSGPLLTMPYAKRLTSEIYELRLRGKEEVRIFYGFKGQTIYLLHGFKKKTQKTPQKEIDTALNRFHQLT